MQSTGTRNKLNLPISRQFLPFSYLLGIAFLVIVILRIVDLTLQNEFPLGYDARSYVVAARAIREGFSPYDEVHRVEFAPDVVFSKYLYPPVLAVLLVPLSAYRSFPSPMGWFSSHS